MVQNNRSYHHHSPLEGEPIDKRLMFVAAFCAIFFHLGLVGFVVYLTYLGQQDIVEKIEPKMLRFEEVQLLQLGEEKPEGAMPQIANPPPKTRKTDPVVVPKEKPAVDPEDVVLKDKEEKTANVETESKRKDGTTDKEVEKKVETNDLLDALSELHDPERPVNDVVPEGSSEGVAKGTTSNAALATLMNTYQAQLLQALANAWQLPTTLSTDDVKNLAGLVSTYVRIASDGSIISYRFLKTSGNTAFDGSIDRALRRFTVQGGGRKLPLPKNEQLKEIVLRQGLNLADWTSIQN